MKYEIIADTGVSIDLHNGYTIIGISKWENERKNYTTTLFIKDNCVDRYDLVEVIEFNINNKKDLSKQILKYVENTDFSKYIKRTKYEFECFERGNALYERERLNAK